ncbi:alpha-(1,3)-fucosyltransferase 4 [Ciona intestinalis]
MFTFFSMESTYSVSVMREISFDKYDNYFNWTMTYKQDSDIFFPYIEWSPEGGLFNGDTSSHFSKGAVHDILSQKQSDVLALWIVSNCGTTPGAERRRVLVGEMESARLTIEKKGACFGSTMARGEEYIKFAKPFKFYLAFENSFHCRDYVTEKFWTNGLEAGLVPIVWGPKREDVEALAPNNSFIFYDDFESSEALVKYLHYLNENDDAYAEFFNWRLKQPNIEENFMFGNKNYRRNSGMCQMCRLLWQKRKYNNISNVIISLKNTWRANERDECLSTTVEAHT